MTIIFSLQLQPNSQYLLVFYFIDDFRNPNHRGWISKTQEFEDSKIGYHRQTYKQAMYSWAPTHSEQGLIAELLAFMNELNGSIQSRQNLTVFLEEVMEGAKDSHKDFSQMYGESDFISHLHCNDSWGSLVFGRDKKNLFLGFELNQQNVILIKGMATYDSSTTDTIQTSLRG
jgi:hypothetical protein